MSWLVARLVTAGLSERAAGVAAWLVGAAALAIAAGLALLAVHRSGEQAGAASAELAAERLRQRRLEEVRADERTAARAAQSIGDRTARADAVTDVVLQHTIQDLRDALDAKPETPPAGAGGGVPPAPVDRLRDALNAGIARANRAADAADAAAGADPD